jgi:hypothetical protein
MSKNTASGALLSQKPPKRLKNDAFDQANSMADRYRGMTQIADDQWGGPAGGRGGADATVERKNEFPVMINKPKKDRDTKLRIKSEYAAQRAGGIDIGKPVLNDSDLQVIQDLERSKQEIDFESWLASFYDLNDPATARLVEEMMPEYYEKRMQGIEHQAELQKNLALIRLRGPKTKQDHMIIYLLHTGRLPMPKGAVFEPDSWSWTDKDFNRGMLSPRQPWFAKKKVDKNDPVGSLAARSAAFGGDIGSDVPNIGGLRTGHPQSGWDLLWKGGLEARR